MSRSPDMMFPRMNNLALWVMPGSVAMMSARMVIDGGPGTGWTLYPPLRSSVASSGPGVDVVVLRLHLAGVSSILGRINFMATGLNMRGSTLASCSSLKLLGPYPHRKQQCKQHKQPKAQHYLYYEDGKESEGNSC